MPDDQFIVAADMVRAAAQFRHKGGVGALVHEACRNLMVVYMGSKQIVMGANEYSAVLVSSFAGKSGTIIDIADSWRALGGLAFISEEQILALDKKAEYLTVDFDEMDRIYDLMYKSFPTPASLFTTDITPRIKAFGTTIFSVLDKAAKQFKVPSYRGGKKFPYEDTWVDFGTEEKEPGRTIYGWTGARNSMVAVAAGRLRNLEFS